MGTVAKSEDNSGTKLRVTMAELRGFGAGSGSKLGVAVQWGSRPVGVRIEGYRDF